MEHYWQECLRLPQRIQEWDAYKEMRDAIKNYLDVFPTLHKLNSKVGSFTWQAICRKGKSKKYKQTNIQSTVIIFHLVLVSTVLFRTTFTPDDQTQPTLKWLLGSNLSQKVLYRHFHKLLTLICYYISAHVNVVPFTIVGDSGWRFNNFCRSHHHSQAELCIDITVFQDDTYLWSSCATLFLTWILRLIPIKSLTYCFVEQFLSFLYTGFQASWKRYN